MSLSFPAMFKVDGLSFDVYRKQEINLTLATDIWGSFVTVTCYLSQLMHLVRVNRR